MVIEQLKSNLQQLKFSSLISVLASKTCKKTNNVHTACHFECKLHLFSQIQRLK